MHKYFPILKSLKQNRIRYLAIGTWALKLAYPKIMQGYQLSDCDILIENDLEQIRNCIRILKSKGWEVKVWGKEMDEIPSATFLKGKYYLRAKQGGLTLDLTYECPLFSWEDLYGARMEQDGFFLAGLDHILALKKAKGRAKDLETVGRFDTSSNINRCPINQQSLNR